MPTLECKLTAKPANLINAELTYTLENGYEYTSSAGELFRNLIETEGLHDMNMNEAIGAFLEQVEATQLNETVFIPISEDTAENLVRLNTIFQK